MKQTRYLDIAKRLASLPKDKRQLFREKLAQQGIDSWQLPIVSTEQTSVPLSLAQQRFLVAEQMSTRALYNLCSVLRFDNGLNIEALTQAITALIERHQVLRTRYIMDDRGSWTPEVIPTPNLSLAPKAVSLANDATLKNWYQTQYEQELEVPFDLGNELPLRVELYQVSLEDASLEDVSLKNSTETDDNVSYWVFFTIHHVAFDAWSSQQLNQELSLLYSAAIDSKSTQSGALQLPELAIQYSDYASWQAEWLEGDDYQRQCDYWKRKLEGAQRSLALPFDRKRKPNHERSYAGAVQGITLPHELSESLRKRVNDTNNTLYIYFQTAFSWLLSSYSQQTDFCFGSSIASRGREELRPLVGPLLNTLVLRQQLDANPSFEEALKRTQTVTAGAFDNQDLPFEQLQDLLKSDEDKTAEAAQSLFQVMFVHVALPDSQSVSLPGTQVDIIVPEQRHARFDLTLRVLEPSGGDIRLEMEYSAELFDAKTVTRLLNHLEQILVQTLAKPMTRLSEVALTSGLSHQLGETLSSKAQLMNQVMRHWSQPEHNARIALDTGKQQITYQALDTLVTNLVGQLNQKGIKKGDKVAILMPREARQIASLLACWRIGAIALMLDPRQPEQRLKDLVEESNTSLVIHAMLPSDATYTEHAEWLFSIENGQSEGVSSLSLAPWNDLKVQNDETAIADISSLELVAEGMVFEDIAPEDIAYILYTSGSTGKPKGVLVSHSALAHYSAAISQAVPSVEGGRWLTLATVAADLGLTSVLAALYQGQTLLLPEEELAFNPPELAEFLRQHPADYLKIVPSHLKGLLSVSSPIDILPKRALISGGEGMDEALLNQLHSLAPDMAIFNHYGPSETTVGVSYIELNDQITDSFEGMSSVAPLGRALPESCLEIRAENGVLLPQGAMGELCISGPQLANGYFVKGDAQAQTASKDLNAAFVESTASSSKSATNQRYYRTGDRARLNNQGVFEYLGRLDDQIKRRGYRLELGEVSGWLQVQAEVSLACALVLERNGRSLLIAAIELSNTHLSTDANESKLANELLVRMKAAMPDYMVPDNLVFVDKIALNANGKIDRKKVIDQASFELERLELERLELDKLDREEQQNKPSSTDTTMQSDALQMNANQTLLAGIWCQLLGIDAVALDDDFYALGGDSILSLQLIGLARQQGAVLTSLNVMKHRTLRAMASCLPLPEADVEDSVVDPVAIKLRDLYRDILGKAELDHNADFYQAGGDSILSLQLIARARTAGVTLSPKLLAQHKTPISLANVLFEATSDKGETAKDAAIASLDKSQVDKSQKASSLPQTSLKRVDRSQPQPLSDAQKRIWFMQQIAPESSAWNVMQRLSIKGELDLKALEVACHAIMNKHDILRTSFISQDDQVVQQVLPIEQVMNQVDSPFTCHQVSYASLDNLVEEKENHVFDLEAGLLWSLDVFCLPGTDSLPEYQLLINIHHIATDGWSMGLLVQEFLAFYSQSLAGHSVEQLESSQSEGTTYIDWVASKQAEQTSDVESYWLERLTEMPQTISLATDYTYPEVQTDNGARVEGVIPTELIAQLDQKAQDLNVTPFQLLFAAWKLLLWRYSGQDDFAVGVPVSGREDSQTQKMVGVFINTIVCRSQIDASLPLDEWLVSTATRTMEDLNESIPLERLLEIMQPERNMARPALFQTLFNYQVDTKGQRKLALPGLAIEAIEQTHISSKSELSLNLFRQDSLGVQLEYNRDVFSEATVTQIFEDYQAVISQMVGVDGAVRKALHELQLPSMAQGQAQGAVYSVNSQDAFIQRFEVQVEATPDALALQACDRALSYRELNHEANRLAHWLIGQGVRKSGLSEPLVALCLPRNSQLLVALLAIQKAGAAYVPLDPTQPKARLSMIAERSGATLCLCDSGTIQIFEALEVESLSPISLDALTEELSTLSNLNAELVVPEQSLAYTLYTSGSTGVPKGVQLERRQFANFLRAMERVLPPFNKVLALTTITFDIAGLELFLPLVNGAAVILADEDARRDGEQIGRLIREHDIDLIQATPSGWRLLDEVSDDALSNVVALAGGEALDNELASKLKRQCRDLINVYGPTETTVWSSSYLVQDTSLPLTPIGAPLLNNDLHVLDAQLQPVPRGVVGELYIAGEGVARGYQGQADLTAERFLPNPFGDGGRLYRTGDLVKRLADGTLYFVGRVDQQVKLRGFRIELGEIEAALLSHASIKQAAVTIEQERLIAWCVTLPSSEPNSGLAANSAFESLAIMANLQAELALSLPEYMLPQGYEWLSSLPLNASGKVDRNALSKRELSATNQSDFNEASEKALNAQTEQVFTQYEVIVSDIWKALLNLETVNKQDHFFNLGGHSLMAAQVRSRLRAQGYEVSLKTLFETPVLSELAKHLSLLSHHVSDQSIPLVTRQEKMPLSDAQRRLWFMQQLKKNDASFNMSSVVELALQLGDKPQGKSEAELGKTATNRLNRDAIQAALYAVAERHEILRVTYHADANGEGYQRVDSDLTPAFSVVDLTAEGPVQREVIVGDLILEASNTSFDLTAESPLRLVLYKLSENRWLVQLVQHHIASDGWSMALLINDLIEAYQQAIKGQSVALASLPVQYLDYAAWQGSEDVRAKQQAGLDYWRRHLTGMPEQLALPLDRSRTATAGDQGGAVDLLIPEALTALLNQLANEQGCSLFMLLMAAYTAQLHLETGSQDIVMGTDVANRDHGDTEKIIGFFVNLIALRMKPNSMHSFEDYLQQVRQVCLEGFNYQDIPFDRVVEVVQPARIQGSHPLIQALLVMQNTPNARQDLGDLQVTPRMNVQQHSKFDMALFASEETTTKGEQLALRWVYRTSLFDAPTMERLGRDLLALLENIVKNINVPLLSLKRSALTKNADGNPNMDTKSPTKRKLNKLSKMKKNKAAPAVKVPLVSTRPLNDDAPFPLLVECNEKGLDPNVWAQANQALIMEWLEVHGGIVFRGFNLPTPVEFERFCEGIYPALFGQYGDLPKKEVGEKIYQSTPYPNDQMIMFHNESSHQHKWPRRQWFYCEIAAESGGCTPIVDCRALYQKLPEAVRKKLQEKQLKYVRNFSGLDVSWQHFFKTEDRAQVEAICREGNIEFEWYGEDTLRISQVCPAVISHPVTGEMSFFNQIQLHHYSFLEADIREHFLSVAGEEGLPRNVYYGDGEPLEQTAVDLISELYEANAVRFDWRHGDVVMLDNMLAAHARDPFEGTRKMAVAMGDIYHREQLEEKVNAEAQTQVKEDVL